MLAGGERLYAYEYFGYWKDVGTVESLWEANMELLSEDPPLNLYDDGWRIFSRNPNDPPQFVGEEARIENSMICEGCVIYGEVVNSLLSPGVVVEKGALVRDSIIMDDTRVCENAKVSMAIIEEEVTVGKAAVVGEAYNPDTGEKKITVVARRVEIAPKAVVPAGQEVRNDS
jgi:glucose-1-phosphate adenylyltransferase